MNNKGKEIIKGVLKILPTDVNKARKALANG